MAARRADLAVALVPLFMAFRVSPFDFSNFLDAGDEVVRGRYEELFNEE